ncbi:L,D-transpeptidase [Rhizobium alvei]|uniref:L,D-transpeptidase n=1 Tax=Rhizobium alvei TaxID=1132659 RepID=A0ABT8YSZ7_9HYPH|nr:L,D-transpeptidase [Rhizobium alvei]MDO6966458.1 L,D-transpeptidase [Rhizobium alvei]
MTMRLERRALLGIMAASLLPLAGCTTTGTRRSTKTESGRASETLVGIDYVQPLYNEPYFVPGIRPGTLPEKFQRHVVANATGYPPGTIVVNTSKFFLYLVQPGGKAIRYGIGIGRDGFGWKGEAVVGAKREWPNWRPPNEMVQRDPHLQPFANEPGGLPGGTNNPIGARALYLYQNGRDTLYRIHGATEAESIGAAVTSGCVRMLNVDVIDLYNRVPIGAKVIVL